MQNAQNMSAAGLSISGQRGISEMVSNQYAAPSPMPQPTDMQMHVGRAQDINLRLNSIHAALAELVARLYGEGSSGQAGVKAEPKHVGICHELTGTLSDIEDTASRLQVITDRLQSLA